MSYLEYCENEVATQRKALKEKDARIAKLEALVAERDAMLGKRPCQNNRCNELNAARADLETARKRDEEWHEHTTQKALELTDAIFELSAARELLREVVEEIKQENSWACISNELHQKICDTLEGK